MCVHHICMFLCSDKHSIHQINQLTKPNQTNQRYPFLIVASDRQLAAVLWPIVHFYCSPTTCYIVIVQSTKYIHHFAHCGLIIWNWCIRCHTASLSICFSHFAPTWNAFSNGHTKTIYIGSTLKQNIFLIYIYYKKKLCTSMHKQWQLFPLGSALGHQIFPVLNFGQYIFSFSGQLNFTFLL